MNMKISQRNIFTLAFEATNRNLSMINEPMLKYYLNKCIKIDKDKFRFLSSEEHAYDYESIVN